MSEIDVEGGALSVVTEMVRGEVDSQIEIAKRYPRSMEKFKKRASEMACIDEETAASCLYRRPVGKENGRPIFAEGMSVRLAEIVGASYGNLRVYATILSQTDRQVIARGMAIDLEANFASSSEVVEATVTSDGKPFSERMRAVVAKAALAKARRDATFQVVPKALAKPIEQAVRQLLLGEAKSLDTRRKAVAAWISTLGIDAKRVFAALGIAGIADLSLDHIETLTGLRTAIKDGEVTIDEAFPYEPVKQPKPLEAQENVSQPKPTPISEAAKVSRRTKATKADASGGLVDSDAENTRRVESTPGSEAQAVGGEKTQEDLIAELLLWVENAPEAELMADDNFLLREMKKIKGTSAQLTVLKPFNERRRGIAK